MLALLISRSGFNHGVPKLNIYILRALFFLIVLNVGSASWTHLLTFKGPWDPVITAYWCMWTAFSTLSFFGIFQPLKMLPLILFEIIFKLLWLIIVAFPLWKSGQLDGSPAEDLANAFIWVILAIVATPWRYVYDTYFSQFWLFSNTLADKKS